MDSKSKHTGFAIAIAWPETYCKQPGSWYDPITLSLGINRNHYYRVGHAAVILVNTENKSCHYFDFGRYHSPFQHGRVRGIETDHELGMDSSPIISGDNRSIINIREIIFEIQHNKACHGEGELFASYCRVNFQAAFDKATRMQEDSPIPYGPFRLKGSNCSRFVNTVIRAGKPGWKYSFRLKFLVPFTPTPMHNVRSLDHKRSLPEQLNIRPFNPAEKLPEEKLKGTLQAPNKDAAIPESAQWLSGEGAGSWFFFEVFNNQLKVIRYSPDGDVECSGLYESQHDFESIPDRTYKITYPSNCKTVSFRNGQSQMRFERITG